MTDPWYSIRKSTKNSQNSFEDNFTNFAQCPVFPQTGNCECHLRDSNNYIQSLERKLEKLKKDSKLVDALSEKREDCWRSLLRSEVNRSSSNGVLIELEERVSDSNSAIQSLYRQIQPIQPITVGETVHILKFEQLEQQQRLEDESTEKEEESRRQSSEKY
ncbi:uncharacterized protein LOC119644215 [Glossina fuscipes]|uniref:Uncharacterized protein LOC119644215 n=1 Tax=Glossina fuscipes TaxID=7396 RepID=A0A9C6E0S1_9MUSC|nr:uncharacterized protein LOC119644215 [Glossina fuscipes]